MQAPAELSDMTTIDAFLGGRVEAVQSRKGHHRSGLEAVLLGASVESGFDGLAVDLGAGAGVAGFCLAARCSAAKVVLVERDPAPLACARDALKLATNRNFSARVSLVEADIAKLRELEAGPADCLIVNPPFRDPAAGTRSPSAARATAHVAALAGVEPWLRRAAALLRPGGQLIMIYLAEGLADVLAVAKGRFGDLDLMPVTPRPGSPAHRIMLRGTKGTRGALRILPPLVLHGETGNAFAPAVESVLRDGAGLAQAFPAWTPRRGMASG